MVFQHKTYRPSVILWLLAVAFCWLLLVSAEEDASLIPEKNNDNDSATNEWPNFQTQNPNAMLRRRSLEEDLSNNQTCPPCPACAALPPEDSDPLVLQILVVDSPGIITMGKMILKILLVFEAFDSSMSFFFQREWNLFRQASSLFSAYIIFSDMNAKIQYFSPMECW